MEECQDLSQRRARVEGAGLLRDSLVGLLSRPFPGEKKIKIRGHSYRDDRLSLVVFVRGV